MEAGRLKKINLTPSQEALFAWVKEHHGDQKRKYTFEPYWHHLESVASLVNEHAPEVRYGVEIALCHDLIEDTPVSPEELFIYLTSLGYTEEASSYIEQRVNMITDEYTHEAYPDINRKNRKKLEAQRLIEACPTAQTVKYADIIDNLSTIVEHDPGFARIYLSEKEMYICEMNKGNQLLYQIALSVIDKAKSNLYNHGNDI